GPDRPPRPSGRSRLYEWPGRDRAERRREPMSELQSSTASNTPTDFLTVDQVAALLGVSAKTIRRWVKIGDLAHHRFGRQVRISLADLRSFTEARRQG
ncbi:MAG: hypothetical protein CBC83_07535, partial [Flavobacteriales bacterium TMED123]